MVYETFNLKVTLPIGKYCNDSIGVCKHKKSTSEFHYCMLFQKKLAVESSAIWETVKCAQCLSLTAEDARRGDDVTNKN